MDATKYIWMNDKLVNWNEANVHVLTHSLHYGSAVFEGIRCYNTSKGKAIFRLNDHIKRLVRSANFLKMNVPYSQEALLNAVVKTVQANEVSECYIRPIIYYGYGVMGLNPSKAPVDVSIAVWPWNNYLGDNPSKVMASSYIRIHPDSTNVKAKVSGHYVNSIIASLEAKDHGFDEALLLDYMDHVAEGPGENIFIVKDNVIYTPEVGSILPGITRKTIVRLAKDLGYDVVKTELELIDVIDADEVLFCGTAAEVHPIIQVDDTVINNGKIGEVTIKLKKMYSDVVHGKLDNYNYWLTYI
ncbi:MAG: branched-chain amino acid transaminase [Nanoarchaeota archaeon]